MRIYYVNASEKRINEIVNGKMGTLTERDFSVAENYSNYFKEKLDAGQTITAIYSASSRRCKQIAIEINKSLNLSIRTDERIDENIETETHEDSAGFLNRNMEFISDLISGYDDDDNIICVTGSENITAFICMKMRIKPSKKTEIIKAVGCSCVLFEYDKNKKYIKYN